MKPLFLARLLLLAGALRAQTSETRYPVSELREDLDSLYAQLRANHSALYAQRSKARTDRDFLALRRQVSQPMTRTEFGRIVAPFLAGFQDGHTYLDVDFEGADIRAYDSTGGRFFPLLVSVVEGRLLVSDNRMSALAHPGDEILEVNGMPVAQLLARLTASMSADEYRTALVSVARLFGFLLWSVEGWGTRTELLVGREGRQLKLQLDGIRRSEYLSLLFNRGRPRQLHLYPEESLALIEIREYSGVKTSRAFIDSCFRVIRQQGIRHVALDLRRNGGGNSSIGTYLLSHLTRKPLRTIRRKSWRYGPLMQAVDTSDWRYPMMASMRQRGKQEGDVYYQDFEQEAPDAIPDSLFADVDFYLLTSGRTYSSAHMTALTVKCSGIGQIIGQPSGERLDLTGEIIEYRLPHSKLSVWMPTAIFLSACGDGSQVGVEPDHRVAPTLRDVLEGRDTEVEYLRALIRKK